MKLKTNRVNEFDRLRGFSFITKTISSDQFNGNNLHRNGWKTRQMDSTTTSYDDFDVATTTSWPLNEEKSKLDDIIFDDVSALDSESTSDLAINLKHDQKQNEPVKKDHNSSQLSIELSPSILQLKDLEVICQTQIEQTLIQYETKILIAFNLQEAKQNHMINNTLLTDPTATINDGQIPRGYQSPTSRVRNQQSYTPSKLNKNKISNSNNGSNGNRFASSASSTANIMPIDNCVHLTWALTAFNSMMIIYLLNLYHPAKCFREE